MEKIVEHSVLIFAVSVVVLWISAQGGAMFRRKFEPSEERKHDWDLVLGATLTLLGLIIGFSFSMVISRYDLRKFYEEAEANAIGTEYVRADLLPGDGNRIRELLREYLSQRILFYETWDASRLKEIDGRTAQLQSEMWSTVQRGVAKDPNPVAALIVSGMNDVLNSQGYTQAAWWNRLPLGAWELMAAIAIFCNVLVGYASNRSGALLFLVLPLALSISFFLISDIDSPRAGRIRVVPQNLMSVSESLRAQ